MYAVELKIYTCSKILCENSSKIYREIHKCVEVIDAIENDIAINNNECNRDATSNLRID